MPRSKKIEEPLAEVEIEDDDLDEEDDDSEIDVDDLDAELDEHLNNRALDEEDDEEDEAEEGSEDEESDDEDDEEGPSSLDQLIEKRAVGRVATDDADDDDDILALPDEELPVVNDGIRAPVIPLKAREEFVCRSCFLVKAKSQLSDPERQLCRDCV